MSNVSNVWLQPQKCKTCVFNGDKGYGNPHKHRVVKEALAKGDYVSCHSASGNKVCAGFNEHYPTASNMQRVMYRLDALSNKGTTHD